MTALAFTRWPAVTVTLLVGACPSREIDHADGARLSKRHGAVGVMAYKDEGILPEALLNYLVRLGWSHGDQELFSREELIALFDLDDVNKSPSTFNPEKLQWLNQMHIRNMDANDLGAMLKEYLERDGVEVQPDAPVNEVADALRERAKTMVEMAANAEFFFRAPQQYDPKSVRKFFTKESLEVLSAVRDLLSAIEQWTGDTINDCLNQFAQERALNFGKIAQPIRTAVAGVAVSPSIDVTLMLLGKSTTLDRLDAAIAWIGQQEQT